MIGPAYAEVDRRYPGLDTARRRHEALRRVFGAMVSDVIETSRTRLQAAGATSAQQVRELGCPVIRFSDPLWADLRQIRTFLFDNMYRAPRVMQQRAQVARVVEELFPIYMSDPELLPRDWQAEIAQVRTDRQLARHVADYIAGMTDRFALQQHKRLTGKDIHVYS